MKETPYNYNKPGLTHPESVLWNYNTQSISNL